MYHNVYNHVSTPSSPTSIARQKVRNLRASRITRLALSENVDPFADPTDSDPKHQTSSVPSLRCTSSVISKRPTRSPLSIVIPPLDQHHSQIHNFFNSPPSTPLTASATRESPSTPTAKGNNTTPRRLDVETWLASARQRARLTAGVNSSKLVAAKLLARNSPRPLSRLPPSAIPRPYVKSRLSSMVLVDA